MHYTKYANSETQGKIRNDVILVFWGLTLTPIKFDPDNQES